MQGVCDFSGPCCNKQSSDRSGNKSWVIPTSILGGEAEASRSLPLSAGLWLLGCFGLVLSHFVAWIFSARQGPLRRFHAGQRWSNFTVQWFTLRSCLSDDGAFAFLFCCVCRAGVGCYIRRIRAWEGSIFCGWLPDRESREMGWNLSSTNVWLIPLLRGQGCEESRP